MGTYTSKINNLENLSGRVEIELKIIIDIQICVFSLAYIKYGNENLHYNLIKLTLALISAIYLKSNMISHGELFLWITEMGFIHKLHVRQGISC